MREFGLEEASPDVYQPDETAASPDVFDPGKAEDQLGFGAAIASELVKSYGFDRDPETGDWSWSLGNIGRAFEEEPMWTTLDWVLTVVPPAKWAVGLRRVAKGAEALEEGADSTRAGVAAKALAGARSGDEETAALLSERGQQVSRFGRFMGSTLGYGDEELGAVSVYFDGPGQLERLIYGHTSPTSGLGKMARTLNPVSPVTQSIDEDYIGLLREYGSDPAEMRAVGRMFARDKMALLGYYERTSEEIIRTMGRNVTTDEARQAISFAMENGLDASNLEWLIRAKGAGMADDALTAEYRAIIGADEEVRRFILDAQREIGQSIRTEDAARLLQTDSADLLARPGARREFAAAWRDRRLLEEAAILDGMEHLNPAALRAYQKTIDLRDELHDAAYAVGLIGEETYEQMMKRYRPRRYEEYENLRAAAREAGGRGAGSSDEAGRRAFQKRTVTTDRLTQIEDELGAIYSPELTADQLAKVGFTIAEQSYAQRLANSVVAKTGDELWMELNELIAGGDARLLALNGVTEDVISVAMRHSDSMSEAALDDVARSMGWGKIEDLYNPKTPKPLLKHTR